MTFFIHFFREERGRERERGRGVTKHLFNYSFLNWRIITYSAIFFFFGFGFVLKYVNPSIHKKKKMEKRNSLSQCFFVCLFGLFVCFFYLPDFCFLENE